MKRAKLKKKLREEANSIVIPEVYQKVISSPRLTISEAANEKSIHSPSRSFFKLAGILAGIVIIACLFPIINASAFDDTVYATISIDINPAVEIEINKDNKVIRVVYINQSAEDIIDAKKQRKKPLEEVIDTLVVNAIDQRYIRENTDNTMLIAIESSEEVAIETLKQELTDRIQSNVGSNIRLEQIYDTEQQLSNVEADNYHITRAKLKLIKRAYRLNKNNMTEDEFINHMRNRSLSYIMRYINESK